MAIQPSNQYQFGPFVLNSADRALLREGQPVALRPKAFDLLLILVARPNKLVRKEELMDALWPGVAVEENNLDKTISTLRRALGGSGNGVSYIETVPKHGYRFVPDGRIANGDGTEPERVFELENRESLVVEEVLEHGPQAVVSAAELIEKGADAHLVSRSVPDNDTLKATETTALANFRCYPLV